jgi:hypothetical protein
VKITAFDDAYPAQIATGGTWLGFASGSNNAEGNISGAGDVVGDPGDYSVVGLRRQVSLSSNIGGTSIGDVLTIVQTSPRLAMFATPSNTSVPSNTLLRVQGGAGAVTTIATSGAAQTLMVGGANYFDITLTANCTIGFTGWPAAGSLAEIGVRVTENGTGGYTPTFSGVTWIGGSTPTHDTTAATSTEYVFWTDDGGASILGGQIGAGGSASFATPSIVLGTAAAAGAASTVIRSDATIAAFDATVPTTAAFSDAATTGSAAVAARRDHRHGMPAASGVGEILITDTPAGSPLVFADLIQNEAQDDLVYADP